jgi:hypothetical protein
MYGDLGKGFIHVHHNSIQNREYKVDFKEDLIQFTQIVIQYFIEKLTEKK